MKEKENSRLLTTNSTNTLTS